MWKTGKLAVHSWFAGSVLSKLFCVCRCKQTKKRYFCKRLWFFAFSHPPCSLPFQQATVSSKPPCSKPSSSRPTTSRLPQPRPPPSPGSRRSSSSRHSSHHSTRGAVTPHSPTPRRPLSPPPTAALPVAPRQHPAPSSHGRAWPLLLPAPWPLHPTPMPAAGLPLAPRATPSLDPATGKEVLLNAVTQHLQFHPNRLQDF